MNTDLLPSRSNGPRPAQDRATPGRVAKILGALIGAVAACALILPVPAGAATSCPTHGLTLHVAGKASLDVVGLSAQAVSCTKAVTVAREVARDLATGGSISVSGAAGIAIASTTPCAGCATETHVALTYPTGTINVTLKGATKLSAAGSTTLPFPAVPVPRIPGLQFPSFPSLPNIPTFPAPVNPNSGITTV